MNIEILGSRTGGRTLHGSLRRLFQYLVEPKKAHPEYQAGERLLWAPSGFGLVQRSTAHISRARQWADSLAEQLVDHTKCVRGGKGIPKSIALHLCFSFPAKDSSRLAGRDETRSSRIKTIVAAGLKAAGFGSRPYAVVVHGDRPHLHAHVVVALADYRGKLWNSSYSKLHLSAVAALLEDKFQLNYTRHPLAGSPAPRPRRRRPPRGQIFTERRTGERSAFVELQSQLDLALCECGGDPEVFVRTLESRGIAICLYWRGGRVVGISYSILKNGHVFPFKASSLGTLYERDQIDALIGLRELQHVLEGGTFIGNTTWPDFRARMQERLNSVVGSPPLRPVVPQPEREVEARLPTPSPFPQDPFGRRRMRRP